MTRSYAAAPVAIPVNTALRPALGGLIALGVALGVGRFVYTPILPVMVTGLGLSKSTAGLIASANFAGYLAGALLAASPSLPGPRRAWLLSGLAGSATTTAAMGFVHTVGAFLALRFAGGVASAVVLVLTSTVVLECLAEQGRPGLSAVLFAGVGVGIAVSALLVSALRAAGQGWPALWFGSGALSCLGAVIAAAMIPGQMQGHAPAIRAPGRMLEGKLLRLVIAYGLFGFGYVITATFLVAIVRASPPMRPLEPLVWVVFGVAAAPSIVVWNAAARRFGIPNAFAIAAVAEGVGVLASIAWPSLAGVLLASILVGGTFMGLTALGLVRGRELAHGDARRVLGLMTGAFGLGQIIGPSFAGVLSDRLGSFSVPSIVATVALVGAAALMAK